MRRGTFLLLLVVWLALRAELLATPGYPPDLGQYKLWSLIAARDGLGHLYASSDYDYPPLYAYVLRAMGAAWDAIEPGTLERFLRGEPADSAWLTALIKLPALLGDAAIALLLAAIARASARRDGAAAAGEARDGAAGSAMDAGRASAPALLALAWLFNPAALLDGGHWGQPDSIHSAFMLASFAVAGGALRAGDGETRRAVVAWALLAAAALMKPLAAPLFPLLLLLTVTRGGWRAAFAGMAASIAVALLLFAPFFVACGVSGTADRILRDVGIMSYTSVNAHNVWWIVGPWRDSEAPWLGPLTARHLGVALFLAFLAALLLLAWRRGRARRAGLDGAQALALAGLVALAFFMLSTHMHENHAFGALPLLAGALAASSRGASARVALRRAIAGLSIAVVLNLAPHDFAWRERWPFSLGADQPYVADAPTHALARGEWIAGGIGTAWNVALFALLVAWGFGGGLVRLGWRTTPPAPASG